MLTHRVGRARPGGSAVPPPRARPTAAAREGRRDSDRVTVTRPSEAWLRRGEPLRVIMILSPASLSESS